MNALTIQALVKRNQLCKIDGFILRNSSRFIFEYSEERLSVMIFDIEHQTIDIDEEKRCKITFLDAQHISEIINEGDKFTLTLAGEIAAKGIIVDILSK